MNPTALLLPLLALLAASPPAACAPPPPQDPPEIPADTEIQTTPSGLKYSVLVPGKEGESPSLGDKVKVHYRGWLTDGTPFESSLERGEPAQFVLGQVIAGWNEALQKMTRGAKWKLRIPPELGYGARGKGPGIPPNATLIFEVELLDFTAMPRFRPGDPEAQKTTESGLVWEVLKEGEGEAAAPGDPVEMEFAIWNEGGKLLQASAQTGQPLKSRVGDLNPLFLNEAAQLLRQGARYRFEVPPELAFGARAMGPDLPANSRTVWELELTEIFEPLPVPAFSMSEERRMLRTPSGLGYEVIRGGEGRSPKDGQTVTVHYAGWLTDGTLFDSSYGRGEAATFPLGKVMPGWTEGLKLMKEGAVYKFTIPPELAYGQRPPPGSKITPGATLVFQFELIEVKK